MGSWNHVKVVASTLARGGKHPVEPIGSRLLARCASRGCRVRFGHFGTTFFPTVLSHKKPYSWQKDGRATAKIPRVHCPEQAAPYERSVPPPYHLCASQRSLADPTCALQPL